MPTNFFLCESWSPEDSENVVLFGRASFLTGVITAQSRIMSAKVEASPFQARKIKIVAMSFF